MLIYSLFPLFDQAPKAPGSGIRTYPWYMSWFFGVYLLWWDAFLQGGLVLHQLNVAFPFQRREWGWVGEEMGAPGGRKGREAMIGMSNALKIKIFK